MCSLTRGCWGSLRTVGQDQCTHSQHAPFQELRLSVGIVEEALRGLLEAVMWQRVSMGTVGELIACLHLLCSPQEHEASLPRIALKLTLPPILYSLNLCSPQPSLGSGSTATLLTQRVHCRTLPLPLLALCLL